MRLLSAALLAITLAGAPGTPAAAGPNARVARPALPFIEDDYPKALALARARKLPLFVDAWAPW